MLLSDLAQVSVEVAYTASRLAKRAALARALHAAGADEIATVVTYLSGRLRQRRTGVGWASFEQVSPAAEPTLTVADVDAAFEQMSVLAGAGSQEQRREALTDLLGRATEPEQIFLWRLVTEDLRQGALDGVMLDAIAQAFDVQPSLVRRASMLLGSTAAAAELVRDGPDALERIGLVIGVPIRPMLASAAPALSAAIAKAAPSNGAVVVDAKLDGIRIQVHRNGNDIHIFTRSLDDITERLPEVVEVVRSLPARRLVLDGEAIVLRPGGRPAPFQVTAARTASRADLAGLRARAPVSTVFFDLLHRDGRDLLEQPLRTRLDELHAVVSAAHRAPGIHTSSPEQAQLFFDETIAAGHEGVIVKALDSGYDAGRRGSAWVKVKPRHTLDLVVLAAEWGHGRRAGWLSNLHLGARDPSDGSLVMLGKTFKGLTDATLAWQTEQFLAREVRRTTSTVFVRPELLVEVAFDGLQSSSRYPGGVALRFARVLRYRDDKSIDEADTMATVLALHAANEP
ncbi:MAG: ATP-dependent DNA ligase [Nocardioidaceae bacterium]|nr:ATP-dependent DNA ligase [Nocardioidaceae bacterium]